MTEGKPRIGDKILYYKDIRKGSKLFNYQTETFSYTAGNNEITSVVAYDVWSDDTGGNAEIVSGGVGCSRVTVKVTSELNRGFHFEFYVFGKEN